MHDANLHIDALGVGKEGDLFYPDTGVRPVVQKLSKIFD